jgi:hypothetical protein
LGVVEREVASGRFDAAGPDDASGSFGWGCAAEEGEKFVDEDVVAEDVGAEDFAEDVGRGLQKEPVSECEEK